jgi:adenosylcobinamide-GDP ribazoletransferase
MKAVRGLSLAVAMFTVAPVPSGWHREATPVEGPSTIRWLPALGLALGALAGLGAAAVLGAEPRATFIAAVVGVALLALLTRGLHLDGLADTADGLGSRRPADEALQIMRQSDIGPFGVIAIVFVIVLDLAAVAMIANDGVWCATAALAVAAATGRLAVVHATGPTVRSARVAGFGTLVAGATSPVASVVQTGVVLGVGWGIAALTPHAGPLAWVSAQAVALLLAWAFRLHVTRRFGGVTGDVFGALIEIATAVTLVGIALS